MLFEYLCSMPQLYSGRTVTDLGMLQILHKCKDAAKTSKDFFHSVLNLSFFTPQWFFPYGAFSMQGGSITAGAFKSIAKTSAIFLYLSILLYLHVQLSDILDPFTRGILQSSLFHRRNFSYLVGTERMYIPHHPLGWPLSRAVASGSDLGDSAESNLQRCFVWLRWLQCQRWRCLGHMSGAQTHHKAT